MVSNLLVFRDKKLFYFLKITTFVPKVQISGQYAKQPLKNYNKSNNL